MLYKLETAKRQSKVWLYGYIYGPPTSINRTNLMGWDSTTFLALHWRLTPLSTASHSVCPLIVGVHLSDRPFVSASRPKDRFVLAPSARTDSHRRRIEETPPASSVVPATDRTALAVTYTLWLRTTSLGEFLKLDYGNFNYSCTLCAFVSPSVHLSVPSQNNQIYRFLENLNGTLLQIETIFIATRWVQSPFCIIIWLHWKW